MVDLEKERKAFEEQWRLLGGHLLYVEWSTDNMYSLSPAAKVLNKNDQISLFNTINTAWGLWVVQAKQNKTVIDSLKAENAALKEKLGNMEDCWYWDGAEYYVTDPYQYDLNDLDNFEIITLEKYQTTPRVPEYFCKVFEDEDTCEIIAFPDYADAKKAIANNKRIFNEAQGDGDE
ncbi:hypothetical protein [Acinetobacter guerrae]|uniref:hypothetical protein n=1 Tax=Acinetobacter guerrae TaxID=1843371 RepID=UPI00125F20F5|nr:hypothetical protein [Acinetobacter guerrae]